MPPGSASFKGSSSGQRSGTVIQQHEVTSSMDTPQASQGDESVLERGLSQDLAETHESLDADNLFFDQNEALKSDLVRNGITVQGSSMQNSFLE